MLFHVSEEPGIELFEPRASEIAAEPVVWAINDSHLHNYLLPRDCPRVTYYAGPQTTRGDVQQFLGLSRAVVAVESDWFKRLQACRMFCYHLSPDTFESIDSCAGYFVSRVSVKTTRLEVFDDVIAELLRRHVELRFLPSLWSLRDAVVASTLQFSLIRMRNARPRIGDPTSKS
jgi:hypothetical protein